MTPAPSLGTWVASVVSVSVGRSISSSIVRSAEPLTKPPAAAVRVKVSSFSGAESWMASTLKVAEDWSAGMTTTGRVIRPSVEAENVTASGASVIQFRWTVPVTESPSMTVVGSRATCNVGTSVSSTVSSAVPETKPAAEAVSVGVWLPSTRPSSTAATAKVADAWPAGIVTVMGTVAADVSSLARVTTRSVSNPALRETVAVAAFAPAASETVERSRVSVSVGTNSVAPMSSPETSTPLDAESDNTPVAGSVWT